METTDTRKSKRQRSLTHRAAAFEEEKSEKNKRSKKQPTQQTSEAAPQTEAPSAYSPALNQASADTNDSLTEDDASAPQICLVAAITDSVEVEDTTNSGSKSADPIIDNANSVTVTASAGSPVQKSPTEAAAITASTVSEPTTASIAAGTSASAVSKPTASIATDTAASAVSNRTASKAAKTKTWDDNALTHPDVVNGHLELSSDGHTVYCRLCRSTVRMKTDFRFGRYTSSGGHSLNPTHKSKVLHAENLKKKEAKQEADRAAKGLPPKPKEKSKSFAQQSLFGFVAKQTPKNKSPTLSTSPVNINPPTANNVTATRPQPQRATCTGIIPIDRLTKSTSNAAHIDMNFVAMYGVVDNSEYKIKNIDDKTIGSLNIFCVECDGVGLHVYGSKKYGGVRCNLCRDYWRDKSSIVSKKFIRRATVMKNAVKSLLKEQLTDSDIKCMKDFNKSSHTSLTKVGSELKHHIKERLAFYNVVSKIPACTKASAATDIPGSVGSLALVTNVDPFLKSFIDLYTNNKDVRDSLLVALLHGFVSKLKGHKNPRLPEKALNFFIAADATSRKCFDFVSANVIGPCLRTIQRHNSKNKTPLLVSTSDSEIEDRLNKFIDQASEGCRHVGIAVSIDATKTPPVLTLCTAHKCILGGVVPNECIDVSGKTQDEVASLLAPTSNIVRAREIKVAVISITNHVAGRKNPSDALAGYPQTINMVSNFNDKILDVAERVCAQRKDAAVVSACMDGISTDTKFIRGKLVRFLKGEINYCAMVDTNHNMKNFRYMLVGGSCVVFIGNYVLDPQLLVIASVPNDLWRIKDWASDAIVLKMASSSTVEKVVALENEEAGSIAALCMTLYMMRLRLYAVNAKVVDSRDRIAFMWASLLWFTSLKSKSRQTTSQANMSQNRKNLITETIGMIHCMARSDVTKPRYLTTEPNEHMFGGWREDKREATVQQCCEISTKKRNKMNAVHASGLKVSRDPKKGYAATLDSFVDANVPTGDVTGGRVNVTDADEPAAELLWEEVRPIINGITRKTRPMLLRFGVKEDELSPFCVELDSLDELLALYLEHGPKDDDINADEEDGHEAAGSDDANAADIVSMDDLGDLLAEANNEGEVVGDGGNVDAGETTGNDSDLEVPNDGDLIFGKDPDSSAMKKFRAVLQSSNLEDMIGAVREAIAILDLKSHDRGASSSDRKFKSLTGRYFIKDGNNGQGNNGVASDATNEKIIKRNVLISMEVKDKNNQMQTRDFRVLGIYTKSYNKWYLCDKGWQKWDSDLREGAYRLYARMIEYDHGIGCYEDTDPAVTANFDLESIYVLCDANYVVDVQGMIRLDN